MSETKKNGKCLDKMALLKEISSLKHQLGGLKTSNARYRATIDGLQLEIGALRGNLAAYKEKSSIIVATKDKEIVNLKKKIANLENSLEDVKKPWWKKIF